MNVLIITEDVGKTAPGIVFNRLIRGLALSHRVTLVSANFHPDSDIPDIQQKIILPKKNIHSRLSRLFITFLGADPFDISWASRVNNELKMQANTRFDLVFSFLSYSHFGGIIAGYEFSKINNAPFAVYSVDAIPPPPGWLKKDLYYSGLLRMIRKYLSYADYFFSLNKQMLEYMLGKFNHKKGFKSGIIYTSVEGNPRIFPALPRNCTNRFIYTGGIYGLRKPDYIIEGFRRLLEVYPDSELIFIGTQFTDTFTPQCIGKKIRLLPYTKDLDTYYKEATALVDIDADIDNDVFLSSKIPNYLMVNRIIISETGSNSPSAQLFRDIQSIIQCGHDPIQLCSAMKKAIELRNTESFEDRNQVIRLFQIDNIIENLNNILRQ